MNRIALTALLVLVGFAWSPPALDWWIGSGEVQEPRLRAVLWGVAAALCALGLANLVAAPSRTLLRADLVALALLLALPLAGEAGLRAGIARDLGGLREPLLYADPMADDDYWLMRAHWIGDSRINAPAVDPELGWSVPPSESDPFGVVTLGPVKVDPSQPAVLFFGDSFVAGPVDVPELIPQQLGALLDGLPVLNFGVGSYGLDQIVLRLERALPRFPEGIFVFGLMTRDIDRAILGYRSGQKQRAGVEDGRLVIRGAPVERDPAAWLARHPPAIRSFFFARLVQWHRRRSALGGASESPYRRELKTAVAELLFERVVEATRGRPLVVVLFDPRDRLEVHGWRETLCRELIARHELPWVDTSAALLRAAEARGLDVQSFYREDNHPTGAANRVIALAVAEKLSELGWARTAASASR